MEMDLSGKNPSPKVSPDARVFKPRGTPAQQLEEFYLPPEGFEAMRLCDIEGLRQDEAAERLKVSRRTFRRILAQARRSVTEALDRGLVLHIGSGCRTADDAATAPAPGDDHVARRNTKRKPNGGKTAMPKIAVSSEGPDLNGPVDPRFGRAAGFIIVDPDTAAFEYVDNTECRDMAQGAGIQAAELMTRHGVGVVLTGYVGPKAFTALSAAGIKVGQNLENVSVREAVEKYKSGQVTVAEGPNRGAGGQK
jgi:predicted Fe-Mo cluster-binding NifX family protein/predicted DNA-binding protein (UPF0251 family)